MLDYNLRKERISMRKIATSITIDEETLRILDQFAASNSDDNDKPLNRSEAIQGIVKTYSKEFGDDGYIFNIDKDLWNAYMYYCREHDIYSSTAYNNAIEKIIKGRELAQYKVKKNINHDMIMQNFKNLDAAISVEMMKIIGNTGEWLKAWNVRAIKPDWNVINYDQTLLKNKVP